MPTKIFHPDHGYVLSSDKAEIDALIAKGGQIVKGKIDELKKTEEAPKTKVLTRGRPRLY